MFSTGIHHITYVDLNYRVSVCSPPFCCACVDCHQTCVEQRLRWEGIRAPICMHSFLVHSFISFGFVPFHFIPFFPLHVISFHFIVLCSISFNLNPFVWSCTCMHASCIYVSFLLRLLLNGVYVCLCILCFICLIIVFPTYVCFCLSLLPAGRAL